MCIRDRRATGGRGTRCVHERAPASGLSSVVAPESADFPARRGSHKHRGCGGWVSCRAQCPGGGARAAPCSQTSVGVLNHPPSCQLPMHAVSYAVRHDARQDNQTRPAGSESGVWPVPHTRSRWFAALFLLTALSSLSPGSMLAQSQASTGVLRGTVTDSAGMSIAGAVVTLRNTATNLSRTLTTNSSGVF